jgi:ubiquinone/menaquinone biosynthesis C-methylase UbiE
MPSEADFAPVGHIYDRIAADYADRFGDDLKNGSGDRAVLDVALASARGSGPVLDLGCGPGQIAAIAIAAGMQAIGIDISPNMLAVARRRVPLGMFLRADARALPLTAASCRAAAAFYLLHHLPSAALSSVLAELHRVLEPGGTLVIATHLGTGPQWVSSEWHGITERVAIACYGKDELAARVAAAGFDIESVGSRAPRADEFQSEHGFVRARA